MDPWSLDDLYETDRPTNDPWSLDDLNEVEPEDDRTLFAHVNDFFIDTANAAAGLAKAGVDLVAPGSDASSSVGDFIQMGQDSQSDYRNELRQRHAELIQQAKDQGDTGVIAMLDNYLSNPVTVLLPEALGSVGPFAAAGKVAQGARIAAGGSAAAGEAAGLAATSGLGAAVGGGAVRGGFYEQIQSTDDAQLREENEEYDLLRESLDERSAKDQIGKQVDGQLAAGITAGAGAGLLAGRLGAESAIFKGQSGIGRTAAIEAGTEALQGGTEQLAVNAAVQSRLPSQSLTEDVALSAVQEGLIGAPGGAAAGAGGALISRRNERKGIADRILGAGSIDEAVDIALAETGDTLPEGAAPEPELLQLGYEPTAIDWPQQRSKPDQETNPAQAAAPGPDVLAQQQAEDTRQRSIVERVLTGPREPAPAKLEAGPDEVELAYRQRERQKDIERQLNEQALLEAAREQEAVQAAAKTKASGFDDQQPTAMGLALKSAKVVEPTQTAPAATPEPIKPTEPLVAPEKAEIPSAKDFAIEREKERRNPNGAFLREIARAGGLPLSMQSDITAKAGTDGGNENPTISGAGKLFRKKGRSVDEMAAQMVEAGYLTQADVESATDNGGSNKLIELVQKAIAGEPVYRVADMDQAAQMQADEQYESDLVQHAGDRLRLLGVDSSGMSGADMGRYLDKYGDALVERALDDISQQVTAVESDRRVSEIAMAMEMNEAAIDLAAEESQTDAEFDQRVREIIYGDERVDSGSSQASQSTAPVKRVAAGDADAQIRASVKRKAKLKEDYETQAAGEAESDQDPVRFSRKQTKTPEFKKWFGNSKAVDEKGEPMAVYHGTDADFNTFDTKKSGTRQYEDWGPGIYLTPRKSNADYYRVEAAKKVDKEYNDAYEVYEKASQNTPSINGVPQYSQEAKDALKEFQRIGKIKDSSSSGKVMELFASIKNPYIQEYQSLPDPFLAKTAKKAGYDGIFVMRDGGAIDEIIAFDPNQIKSATDNDGSFDASNPDIRFAKGKPSGPSAEAAKVQAIVNALKTAWANAPEIEVLDRVSQAPKAIRDAAGDSTVEGVFHKGKVYLFADQLSTPQDIVRVTMHETLGHYGLRGAFGDALDEHLDRIVKLRAKEVRQRTIDEGLDPENPADLRHGAEEVLAYLAQERPTDRDVTGSVATIKRIVNKIMRAVGVNRPLTNSEIIRDYLLPAQGWVQRGGAGEGDGETRLSRVKDSKSSFLGDLTAEQEKAAKNVGMIQPKQTIKERLDEFKAGLGGRIRQATVDQFHAIKSLDHEAYVLARLSKGADGALEAALLHGRPYLDGNVYNVDIKDGGFAKVLAGLGGEHDRFLLWVAAQRADRLKAEGRENLFTDKDISSLKTLNRGREKKFSKALLELNKFNDAMLDIAVDSGILDEAARDIYKDQPYVPFYRLADDDSAPKMPTASGGLTSKYAFKKLKGGSNQLNQDLLANILQNWAHLLASSAQNRAAIATMDAAEAQGIVSEVDSSAKKSVKVSRAGKHSYYTIDDPLLFEAVSAMEWSAPSWFKPFSTFKRMLTIGVTASPTFKVRNLMRDALSAVATAELNYNPVANTIQGLKASNKETQTFASMLASGGIIRFGTMLEGDRAVNAHKLIRKTAKDVTVLDDRGWKKFGDMAEEAWTIYSELGDRAENASRAAIYEQLMAKGKSHQEAAFMARDLIDFSMSGRAPVVRFLTATVPFLNARMVGLDKLGRAAKEDPKRFGYMAGAVSLASMSLLLFNMGDEKWEQVEDWERDAYWVFFIGDKKFAVPKPFELGAIGTLAERTAELAFSEEMTPKRYRERVAHMVSGTFAVSPIPQIAKPLMDVYSNRDSFTGRPIESMGMERLRPEDRFTGRTSETARLLNAMGIPDPAKFLMGDVEELSPVQIDSLIRGYFGWLGTFTTQAVDLIAKPALNRPTGPSRKLKDTFFIGSFVETLPQGSSRYLSQFYEQSREINMAYASYQEARKQGDPERAKEIYDEHAEKIQHYKSNSAIGRNLSKINRQIKRVQSDSKMSASKKRLEIDKLSKIRNRMVRTSPTL